MKYQFLTFAFILGIASVGIAQTDPSGLGAANENYRIGPNDVIDVAVSQSAALSRAGVRVSNSGYIQLPMLDNEVPAACRTEKELAEDVKALYKKYLLNPYVTVSVKDFNSTPVAFIGAVVAPGRFQLQRPMRVLELLTQVNGPSDKAGDTLEILRNSSLSYCDGSKLVRPDTDEDQLLSIKLSDTLRGVDGANPIVRAGDILRVSEAELTRAFITGNIRSPMAIDLKEKVTLTQAIAMAGGLTDGAQIEKIKIRRQASGAINRTDLMVNMKEVAAGKRDDVLIQANDIIEVPGPAKNFFRDLLRTIVPTIAQLPIRVLP